MLQPPLLKSGSLVHFQVLEQAELDSLGPENA